MEVQLELFPPDEVLTVEVAFHILWKAHLGMKPCGRPFNSNRKAIVRTIGHIKLKDLSEIHILSHLEQRKRTGVSGQTLKHDIKLITLLYNKFTKWKRKGIVFEGYDFSKFELPKENPTIDIERPQGKKREYIVSRNEWSVLSENAGAVLLERAIFAMDTGLLECDLRMLKITQYDPRRRGVTVTRKKTRKDGFIPLTKRCQVIINKRIDEGKEFVLDWTNHQAEWRRMKKDFKLKFQWRDLRKSYVNAVYRFTGEITKAQRAAIHSSPRTTWEHYIVDDGSDLRPAINNMEKAYPHKEEILIS